jgi:molybdate transport system substrate-binding protein
MIRRLALVVVLLLRVSLAHADEIHVMTSGAFTAPYLEVVPEFERTTGHKVVTAFGASMGNAPDSIPVRLQRGERADIVILAAEALEGLVKQGKVLAGSRVDLVRSRIALAVRAGATKPDISSLDAFVRTVLAATSIAYSASASGTYLSTELFPKLGIADRIKAKSRRIDSEPVGNVVARGEAEIGFQQVSELLPVKGIEIVGPLPEGAQRVTIFSAGLTTAAAHSQAAKALIEYLASPAIFSTLRKDGLEPARAAVGRP